MDYKYDIAFSFAGEDREYVEKVANALRQKGIKLFYDTFEEIDLWGKDLYQHLSEIYKDNSRYTVIFISKDYVRKLWTQHELRSAQARALEENLEYILPARFDDTELPGVSPTIAYINLNELSPEEFAEIIYRKIKGSLKELTETIKKDTEETKNTLKAITFEQPNIVVKETISQQLPLVLYSVNTKMSFLISERYFNQLHYVWCAPYFNISKNLNPKSSNPVNIYNELKKDVISSDRHSSKIQSNKLGILKGATIKFRNGEISKPHLDDISKILELSEISDFIPLVYVIPTKGIENLIVEAPIEIKANPFSQEFMIENLPRDKFDVINIDDEFFSN